MKKVIFMAVLIVLGLGLFWGCATMRTGSDPRSTRIEGPIIEDRIAALQRRIDDGKINGRYPGTEGKALQFRLDAIRGDYLRMTEGGRYITHEERRDISSRLDLLEKDLHRSR